MFHAGSDAGSGQGQIIPLIPVIRARLTKIRWTTNGGQKKTAVPMAILCYKFIFMKAIQHTLPAQAPSSQVQTNPVSTFLTWCQQQEKNRLMWVGSIIALHGCVITPLTLMAIMLNGNSFILWPFALASIVMCLISNLAAMPLKVVIPVFAFSLLVDLGVILAAFGWHGSL